MDSDREYGADEALISNALKLRYTEAVSVAGKGVFLTDSSGRRLLDFEGGGCVANIGYGHPGLVKAISEQYATLSTSCLPVMATEQATKLARRLTGLAPGGFEKKAWFGLSGSDAGDCVFKLARAHRGRPKIGAFIGAYHGQTMGAYAMSGFAMMAKFPTSGDVLRLPYPYCYRCPLGRENTECELACLEHITGYLIPALCEGKDLEGIIFEPAQGDAGAIFPPDGFLPGLARWCRENDLMLYADEVLTGLGRTGHMWGCDHDGVVPDAVMVGKALGSGIPISAVVGRAEIMDSAPVSHPITVAAAPVPARAALETLDVIEKEGLVENARKVGGPALKHIRDETEDRPRVGDVRGRGLLIGVEVVGRDGHSPDPEYAARVCAEAYRRDLFVFAMGMYGNALRVNPPLCITADEMERGISLLCEALDAADD